MKKARQLASNVPQADFVPSPSASRARSVIRVNSPQKVLWSVRAVKWAPIRTNPRPRVASTAPQALTSLLLVDPSVLIVLRAAHSHIQPKTIVKIATQETIKMYLAKRSANLAVRVQSH